MFIPKPKLYIVSTPIGNMADITYRAVEVLKAVDMILSEDTRETDKILKMYGFSKPQISYRDQNHARVIEQIKNSLREGKSLALVSDSGTPLISDPGFKLVRDIITENIEIESIPGPSAVTAALSISGLPTDKFLFVGFLPKTETQKENFFKKYADIDATLIFYESPFRLSKSMKIAHEVLGHRQACVCNDITKLHEEVVRGSLMELSNYYLQKKIKGEYVVLIAKKDY
ncbi:16S rRNA (cytidine(1402)-2'-O)-methyltransferase [candidate division WWE3 bacterium RIFOXYB1_FULL_43_24]|uniref:Ribosomal RNA small subunit methyltransferase I n=2 Tax=Katanobacteria TaxID=422282 RepID=A0A0G1AYU1_UNCKA|nr:MAG: Ribosomal RNA small subunit methyltransferase I [candidate division WWE3 bacterium GW2011_GWA1_42_12]KKS34072.1 MAG: Ribosomal RNA small subunit methyltransferase I [candidate division WWE3 bacterium GW2011_GWD1_42_14]KKS39246.1 MAG: Ribosomal RNA small subunit methyltransferase I [candidate division WWE3 bacterium GW2011_GWF1_42_14]KKS40744.1 MAG: Ribosomal RNA small subunit methyltransferase I [candidate division WWE3 bacterium GW2011_GWE1_42_16]KKS67106.1 MAG: Ribosomal RNA small sub